MASSESKPLVQAALGRGKGAAQEEEEEEQVVDIEIPSGIYTSVLVAALGGMRFTITSKRKGYVHAFWLLAVCVPLFIAQCTTIFLLRSDMDLAGPVYLVEGMNQTSSGKIVTQLEALRSSQLLHLKILMIIILYLANFSVLLNTMRLLLLTMNPITWIEIARSRHQLEGTGCLPTTANALLRASSQAPFAAMALLMRLVIAYLVCTDSVSLILDSDGVTDVIFNSLAITFIVDLNEIWWNFCRDAFHLSWQKGFKVTVDRSVWGEDGQLTDSALSTTFFPSFTTCLIRWTSYSRPGGSGSSVMRRGYGATRTELMFTFFLLGGLYTRQFYVVLFAIKTNILPAARDICTQWRLMHETSGVLRDITIYLQRSLIVDMEAEVTEIARSTLDGHCHAEQRYDRMYFDDMLALTAEYQHLALVFFASLTFILLAPQVIFFVISHIFEKPKIIEPDPDDVEGRVEALEHKIEHMQAEIQDSGAVGVFTEARAFMMGGPH